MCGRQHRHRLVEGSHAETPAARGVGCLLLHHFPPFFVNKLSALHCILYQHADSVAVAVYLV